MSMKYVVLLRLGAAIGFDSIPMNVTIKETISSMHTFKTMANQISLEIHS